LALAEFNLHSTRRLVSHICNSSSAQIVQQILFLMAAQSRQRNA